MPEANKKLLIKSPIGTIKWASLSKPNTKFVSEGVYEATLLLDPDEIAVEAYVKELQSHYKAYCKKEKEEGRKVHKGWFLEPDEETGFYTVRFKQKVYDWMDNKNPIAFFDSKGKPISKVPNIGSTSRVIITAEVILCTVTGKAYLSLRPKAVQIIELVLADSKASAESYGIEAVEGGYIAEIEEAMNDMDNDEDNDEEDYQEAG